jgi:hypothetical protein
MAFDRITVVFNKGDHFHTITFDDTYPFFASLSFSEKRRDWQDHSGLDDVFHRFDKSGYEIVSAVVEYDGYWKEEMVSGNGVTSTDLLAFFEALQENPQDAGSLIAYVRINGMEYASQWEDVIKFSGDSKSAVAQEWHDEIGTKLFKQVYKPGRFSTEYEATDIPDYLSVDWEDTADVIANNEGMSLECLNGTWYLFG